jgi:hypothetical protein
MWRSCNLFYIVHRITGTNVNIFQESITTSNLIILCWVAIICLPTQKFALRPCWCYLSKEVQKYANKGNELSLHIIISLKKYSSYEMKNQQMSLFQFYSYIDGSPHVSCLQAHPQENSHSCSHNHWFIGCTVRAACSVGCGWSWWLFSRTVTKTSHKIQSTRAERYSQ